MVSDPARAAQLWRIREDGAGLAAAGLARPAHAGWEDAAVPPAQLGAYLRDFDALLAAHGLDGLPYGHFGDGCVHVRIDFASPAAGVRRLPRASSNRPRTWPPVTAARCPASTATAGRARSCCRDVLAEPPLALFAAGQADLRPGQPAQPRRARRPAPLDADLRPPRPAAVAGCPGSHDDGVLGDAVHRCTGVGKCLGTGSGGVMCPSYQATGDEKDSTRGRARVLQEVVERHAASAGWRTRRCDEALDLCLSCKGCATRLPDRRRHGDVQGGGAAPDVRRPAAPAQPLRAGPAAALGAADHAVPGWRRWPTDAAAAPASPRLAMDGRRRPPPLAPAVRAPRPARRGSRRPAPGRRPDVWSGRTRSPTTSSPPRRRRRRSRCSTPPGSPRRRHRRTRLLRADLDHHRPARPRAPAMAARSRWTLLHAVRRPRGRRSSASSRPAWPCCAATPPSCSTTRVAAVADGMLTLAELLERRWTGPRRTSTGTRGRRPAALPPRLGARLGGRRSGCSRAPAPTVTRVGGCCGLAGNFGMENGHYEVSVAVAETHLLPAVAPPGPTRSCSPTASPAGSSSPTSPIAARSPSPSCSAGGLPAGLARSAPGAA